MRSADRIAGHQRGTRRRGRRTRGGSAGRNAPHHHRDQHPAARRQGQGSGPAQARRACGARLPDQRHRCTHEGPRLDDFRQRREQGLPAHRAGVACIHRQPAAGGRIRQRHQDEIRRQPPGGDLQRRLRRSRHPGSQDGPGRAPDVRPVRAQPGAGQRRDAPAHALHAGPQVHAADHEGRGLAEGHAGDRRHGQVSRLPGTVVQRLCADLYRGDGARTGTGRHGVGR